MIEEKNIINNEIIQTLLKFQEGYKKRDIDNIDGFANEMFIDSEDTLVIGTGNGEWCKGIDVIKELLYIDWFYWGNFTLDIENTHINSTDNFAMIATTGMLQKECDKEKLSEVSLKTLKTIVESDSTNDEKIYKSLKSMSYFLHEQNVGEDVKRKIRFSAVLIKQNDTWKFSNIHFSYPVSPPTDIKLINYNKYID